MSTSSVLSSYTPRLPVRPFWDWLRRLTFVKGVKRVSVAAGSAHKVWTNATALSSKQVRPRYEETQPVKCFFLHELIFNITQYLEFYNPHRVGNVFLDGKIEQVGKIYKEYYREEIYDEKEEEC